MHFYMASKAFREEKLFQSEGMEQLHDVSLWKPGGSQVVFSEILSGHRHIPIACTLGGLQVRYPFHEFFNVFVIGETHE